MVSLPKWLLCICVLKQSENKEPPMKFKANVFKLLSLWQIPRRNKFKNKRFIWLCSHLGLLLLGQECWSRIAWWKAQGGELGEGEGGGSKRRRRRIWIRVRVLPSKAPSCEPPAKLHLLELQLGTRPSTSEEILYIQTMTPRKIISHKYQTEL